MSGCQGSVPQEVRPGTGRVLVTELSGSGRINPTPAPKPCEDTEEPVESYLSPEKLESLCGTQDLSHVTSLEICVDTQETTLGNFGVYLPKLVSLKMNNSFIMSVRDLGTTLSHLQVLWMLRCSLKDLGGISALYSLKELYLAYNYVSDLSQVGMLENLRRLDLEGNDVNDLVQVQYLELCPKLQALTLEGNPVCVRPNPTTVQTTDYRYRAAVRELIPQLRYLDDVSVEEHGQGWSSTREDSWAILKNSIRDCNSSQAATEDEETEEACAYSRPASARRPTSSLSCVRPLSATGSRPGTSSRPMSGGRRGVLSSPGSRPGSADSDLATAEAETSTLIDGAGKILFCGNPVRAIRARREKLRTAPTRSAFTPRDLPIHVPEHTYDLEEPDVKERVDVLAELRAWREQHSKRLKAIETERSPQVLSIQYSDEEEGGDDGEDESFGGSGSDCSDEEDEEETHGDGLDTASPDSSFQSLSPDMPHREALSPDVARLSLSPDTNMSPTPPTYASEVIRDRKLPAVRARRLRRTQISEHSPELGTATSRGDTNVTLEGPTVNQDCWTTHAKPCPPLRSPLSKGLRRSGAGMDLSSDTPQRSRLLNRPVLTRPHTARAALQKHHPHHTPQPCRGSPHPH